MKTIVGSYISEKQDYCTKKSGILHFKDTHIGEEELFILKLLSLSGFSKRVHRSWRSKTSQCRKLCSTRNVEGSALKLYKIEF